MRRFKWVKEKQLEKQQRVKKTTGRRKSFGGSYTSGNKRLSAKTRSRKGGKKKSLITGVDVRGKQIENKRGKKRLWQA